MTREYYMLTEKSGCTVPPFLPKPGIAGFRKTKPVSVLF